MTQNDIDNLKKLAELGASMISLIEREEKCWQAIRLSNRLDIDHKGRVKIYVNDKQEFDAYYSEEDFKTIRDLLGELQARKLAQRQMDFKALRPAIMADRVSGEPANLADGI